MPDGSETLLRALSLFRAFPERHREPVTGFRRMPTGSPQGTGERTVSTKKIIPTSF